MSQIRLYLDESSRSKKLLQALQSRGVDIITVAETGRLSRSDEE
jgi:hypothetical protein